MWFYLVLQGKKLFSKPVCSLLFGIHILITKSTFLLWRQFLETEHWFPVQLPAFKAIAAARRLPTEHLDHILLLSPSQLPTVWSSATHPIQPNSWGFSPLQSLISYLLHFSPVWSLVSFPWSRWLFWHFAFDGLYYIDTWISIRCSSFLQLRTGPLWAQGILRCSCNVLYLV